MKKTQFKWYILEEILIYLIESSWYKVIDSAPSNDPDLTYLHNWLNLRWRWANHQIDVLWELKFIPPFTYPIRLITEAKFHEDKVWIDVVRSEIWILSDINENYFVIKNAEIKPRYTYKTVIFSASWFSSPAVDLAIAHQIQLVDLSWKGYQKFKDYINNYSDFLFRYSENISNNDVKDIRKYLRRELLWVWDFVNLQERLLRYTNDLIYEIRKNNDQLFLWMTQWWFMILLKPNITEDFIEYAKKYTTHNVTIHWERSDWGKQWYIEPTDGSYVLSFKLPKKLHDWIFKLSRDKLSESLNQKEIHFSNISIHFYDKYERKDYIFNLEFRKENFNINL